MLAIVVNHLAWGPSLYSFITGESSLLASAAEGFFTISGILVGYIYGPRILSSTKAIFKKLWKRALVLYLLAVFFTLLYTAWATLHPESHKFQGVYSLGVDKYFYNTFTLRYAFGWADFLTRYSVFMLFAPFVLWLLAKGKSWLVLLGSILVWALLRKVEILLPFSAWQIIFVFGIVIGYYLPQIERSVFSWSKQTKTIAFNSVVFLFVSTYLFSIAMVIGAPFVFARTSGIEENSVIQSITTFYSAINHHVDKPTLDPLRLLIGVVWFSGIYLLFRRYESKINSATYGTLLLIGKNSLFVYCLHAFVVFASDLYFTPNREHSIFTNTAVTTGVLLIIYFITRYRNLFTKLRHRLLPSTRPN